MEYANRTDAGQRLGARMTEFAEENPVVVGMPRGGIPVAVEVARALGAPLDIAVVRKIGAPLQPEYAIGAMAEGGVAFVSRSSQHAAGITGEQLSRVVDSEWIELDRRAGVYRVECPQRDLTGRFAILVDDGLATGSTAIAAARSLRDRGAAKVILAVPVCSDESLDRPPDPSIDRVVCLMAPQPFLGVGMWYRDFDQVSDEEVLALLREAREFDPETSAAAVARDVDIEIEADAGVRLPGTLTLPTAPRGLVIFAHGSGSSRTSPRNQMVARALNRAGLATVLFDLLDPFESVNRRNVFDIPLLGDRLVAATNQLLSRAELENLPVGLFGASTGAAAALWAASELGPRIDAVVSRGGRPDLAESHLESVTAPTLLIVGGDDHAVIELNREAMRRMRCTTEILLIERAGHLFEGPGQLERVADEAGGWFGVHLHKKVEHAVR